MAELTTGLDLPSTQKIAIAVARQAAEVLLHHFGNNLHESFKISPIDVVTEADRQSEAVIVAALQDHFPTFHIVGEEGGGAGAPIAAADYRWYVDPLDGTVNFANGIPFFCVSLALTDAAMTPLLGVVYNPIADELFTAARGYGATLNGQPLRVSVKTSLQRCVLASGFPYDKHLSPDNNLTEWGNFLLRVRGMRRMGSAELDLCYVAAGRFDGYWEAKLNPWDTLAGAMCVLEAGGRVTDYQGQTAPSLYSRGRVVASNGHIHPQMIAILNGKT